MTDVVLECRDLSKEYSVGPQTLRVLDEVQLRLLRGERVADRDEGCDRTQQKHAVIHVICPRLVGAAASCCARMTMRRFCRGVHGRNRIPGRSERGLTNVRARR
mgnify:CR=1 FL=1